MNSDASTIGRVAGFVPRPVTSRGRSGLQIGAPPHGKEQRRHQGRNCPRHELDGVRGDRRASRPSTSAHGADEARCSAAWKTRLSGERAGSGGRRVNPVASETRYIGSSPRRVARYGRSFSWRPSDRRPASKSRSHDAASIACCSIGTTSRSHRVANTIMRGRARWTELATPGERDHRVAHGPTGRCVIDALNPGAQRRLLSG